MDSGRAQVPQTVRAQFGLCDGRDCLVAPYAALGPPPTGSAVRTFYTVGFLYHRGDPRLRPHTSADTLFLLSTAAL